MTIDTHRMAVDNIAKGGVWLILGTSISRVFAYLYKIIVARLGAAEFGIFSASIAVVETVSTLAALGLPTAVFYFIPHYRARNESSRLNNIIASSVKLTLFASLICSALLFVFADRIASQFLHNDRIALILKILAFIIPIQNIRNTLVKVLVGFQRIKFRVYARNVAEDGTKLVVTAGLFFAGFGIMAAIYGYMAGLLVSLLLSAYLLERRTFLFIGGMGGKAPAQYRDILGYSLPLFLSGFVGYSLRWTDTFVLSYFRTMEEVGIYNVAMITASFVTILPEFFMPSAYPAIVDRFSAGEEEESKRLVRIVNKWILLCTIPAVIILGFFAREIVAALFGKKYTAAVLCAVVLLLGKFLWTVGNIGSRMLTMIRKNALILYINTGLVIMNIILDLILIPRHGMIGAAATTSFVLCLEFVCYIYLARKYFGISLLPLKMSRIVAAGVISLLPFIYLKSRLSHQSVLVLMMEGCAYLSVYAASLWIMRVLTDDDLAVIKMAAQKIKDNKTRR